MNYAERALRTLSAGNRTLLRAQDHGGTPDDLLRRAKIAAIQARQTGSA